MSTTTDPHGRKDPADGDSADLHGAAESLPGPARETEPEPPPVINECPPSGVPPIVATVLPRAEPAPPPQADVAPPLQDPRAAHAAAAHLLEPIASARAKQRKQNEQGTRPAVVLLASAIAILILSGVVYLVVQSPHLSGDRKRQTAEPNRGAASSQTPDAPRPDDSSTARAPITPPAETSAVPLEPSPADEGSLPEPPAAGPAVRNGDVVVQVMIDLHEGQFQSARQHLKDALASPDSQTRSWARSLLEEIEFATSLYEAQKALSELNDEQLEQFTRSDWVPPAVQQLSYPSLRQRFVASLREQLPAEFQRRQVASAEPQGTVESPTSTSATPLADPPARAEPRAATALEQEMPDRVPSAEFPAAEAKTPEERLAATGLVHRGDFWLLEKDDDLKTSVLELNGLDRKFRRVDAEWNEIRQNHAQWQSQQDRARQARQPAMVEQIQQQLRPGREILARWMRTRSEFTLAVLRAAEKGRQELTEYERLADDRAVQSALSELAPASNRLGPSPVFEQNARRIRDFAAGLLNDQTLVYWSDAEPDVFYVDVIVNEAAAATLALQPKATFNLIPEHVLREAGVAVQDDAGRELTIGGVSFFAREVTIPSLRIGQFASRNIRTYVLPANVRRLQGFLSRHAFPDLELTARRSDNVLTIRPQEAEPATPD